MAGEPHAVYHQRMFASVDLAARIERAEASLSEEIVTAIAARRRGLETLAHRFAGGVATVVEPESPINKVIGIGFEGPVDESELATVEAECDRLCAAVQVELSTLADPSIAPMLTGRGYSLVGFENVLGRALPAEPTTQVNHAVVVRPSAEETFERFIDVIVTGFMHPDTQGLEPHESYPRELMESSIRDMQHARGFERYLAEIEERTAGAACVRLCDGVAQLCGAATLPDLRRRGVQSALLHHRLAAAAEVGCDIAVITTQPGSKSMSNAQKQGFALLYPRAVLVREIKR